MVELFIGHVARETGAKRIKIVSEMPQEKLFHKQNEMGFLPQNIILNI